MRHATIICSRGFQSEDLRFLGGDQVSFLVGGAMTTRKGIPLRLKNTTVKSINMAITEMVEEKETLYRVVWSPRCFSCDLWKCMSAGNTERNNENGHESPGVYFVRPSIRARELSSNIEIPPFLLTLRLPNGDDSCLFYRIMRAISSCRFMPRHADLNGPSLIDGSW